MILIGATIRQVKTSVVMICVSLPTALPAAGAVNALGSGSSASAAGAAVHGDVEEENEVSTQQFDGKSSPNNLPSNNDNTEACSSTENETRIFRCPLCSETFPSQEALESHAMSVHSVNSEGLQRLQSLINGSHWLNKKEDQGNNNFIPSNLHQIHLHFT